jgi:AraC-like DNA-binding protein
MASATTPVGSFRFSTESLPPRDRMAIWREVYGRSITRVEMTPVGETPFRVDAGIHLFPDLAMATLEASPLRGERSRELARDNAEGIELLIPINAEMAVSQGDKEMRLGRGDAALMRYHEPGLTHISEGTQFIDLTIPVSVLAPMIGADALIPTVVPADNPALRLLLDYVRVIESTHHMSDDGTRHAIATHIRDLVALMIGATRDAAAVAAGRGVQAARLHAIKADIEANLHRRELSLSTVAARHGISPSYVRKLFNEEDTSFSAFVLDARLAHAYRILSDPRFSTHTISTVAFECGFGDLSYFNRVFRRRYRASPSEIRSRLQAR